MQADVIIVGAGPAGSAAAITLVRNGHAVLMVDQSPFPRDKVCGDGILPGSIQLLNQLGLGKKIIQAGFNPINVIKVVSPRSKVLEFSFSPKGNQTGFYIAPRREFDFLLQQQALALGAEFRSERVSRIIKDKGIIKGVTLQSGLEIFSRAVIGADGASSIVARALRSKPLNNKKLIGIRGYITGLKTRLNCAECYFLQDVFPSYGWIFPTGPDSANIGLGLYVSNYQANQENLKLLLEKFLQHEHLRNRLAGDRYLSNVNTWFYHLAEWSPRTIIANGAVLIGDAGPFMDPLSGEGIRNALHSGIIAGEVLDQAIRSDNCSVKMLKKYERRCKREIFRTIRHSIMIRHLVLASPARLQEVFHRVKNNKVLIERLVSSISSNFEIQ